jgi:hypothetical protein
MILYIHYLLVLFLYHKYDDVFIHAKKTPWSESASELYRPSDRRSLAK